MTVPAGPNDDTRWNAVPSPGTHNAVNCTGSDRSSRTVVHCLMGRQDTAQDTARTEQDLGCEEQLESLAEAGPAAEQQQQHQQQDQQQPVPPAPNPTTLSRQPSSAGSGMLPRSLSFTFGALSPLGSPAKPPGFSAPAAPSSLAAALGSSAQWASPTGTPLLPALPPLAATSDAPATAASAAAQVPLPRPNARSMRLTGSVRLLGDQVLQLPPKGSSSSSPQAPAQAACLPQPPPSLCPAIRQLPFAGSPGALGAALQVGWGVGGQRQQRCCYVSAVMYLYAPARAACDARLTWSGPWDSCWVL